MATDYAQLAKRISGYTTKCLLTVMVVIVGLGFGRQVLQWWSAPGADSEAVTSNLPWTDGLGDPSRLHVLQFGDQAWSLRRQSITGDRQAAAAALKESCREVVRQGHLPKDEPGEAEREFIEELAARDPIEQEPGTWQLYELKESFPMMVGVRPADAPADAQPGGNLAVAEPRVVTWGLAIPAGPDAWNLCTFQSEPVYSSGTYGIAEVELPAGCAKTVSIRVSGGGGLIGFAGEVDAKTSAEFYDRWFAQHNWKAARRWQRSTSAWHARFTAPGPAPAASVDVHFGPDAGGRLVGLLMITPPAGAPTENDDS
ncbi:MAG TPA: hypothetical protein VMY42_00205 [Thermoguttaceae bacterium]|nr:hypothetical protein [Thermoguttaceae bacterium]